MSAQSAVAKRKTVETRLRKVAGDLVVLCQNPNDMTPTEATLERKIQLVEGAWKTFEDAHTQVLELSTLDADGEAEEAEYYNTMFDVYEGALGPASELLDLRRNPAPVSNADKIQILKGLIVTQSEVIKKMFASVSLRSMTSSYCTQWRVPNQG